jgi:hypothetical protein
MVTELSSSHVYVLSPQHFSICIQINKNINLTLIARCIFTNNKKLG